MGGVPPMATALGSLLKGPSGPGAPGPMPAPGGAPMPPPLGSATGAPPPTGIGALPNQQGLDPHTAASSAVASLKDLKALFPHAGQQIDAMMAQIQAMAKSPMGGTPGGSLQPPPPPPPPVSAPSGPPLEPPDVDAPQA